MQKQLAFFGCSFRSQMMYRAAALAGVFSAALGLAVQISLWSALIGSGAKKGVTLREMIAYVVINTVFLTLTRSNIANELGDSIRDGSVVMHFVRPVSMRLMLYSSSLGRNAYSALTTVLPVAVLGALFAGFPLPGSLLRLCLSVLLAIAGMLVLFEIHYIVGLIAFWTQATWFLSWYIRAGVTFFGGTAVPLWFYPAWLNTLSLFIPFRYITFEAIQCYLGKTSMPESVLALAVTCLWLAALYGLGRLVWHAVQQKMTINGG